MEQLESISSQTHANWTLWASDDGSWDRTLSILQNYKNKWGPERMNMLSGPGRGFAFHFLSLACNAGIQADYYAYSDQDDVWESDKLEAAVRWLKTIPSDIPALYCTRTRLVNAYNNEIGMSPLFTRPPHFTNALVQNIAGGNTMVFNNAARNLLREAGADIPTIAHDWWTYLVITGCGGKVFYNSTPMTRYRQHGHNLIGNDASCLARFRRLRGLWQGDLRRWNTAHISALYQLQHRLTSENFEILKSFSSLRKSTLIARLILLRKMGLHRQTLMGNICLVAATILGRV
jgi:glycosyltransferase involved in cell wall biosynthesis